MHAKDFLRMFAYDDWANRECLAAMRAANSVSADTVGRMAHILSAQKLWLERVLKQPQSMPVWPDSTIEDCVALADEMSLAWRNYLTRVANQFAPGSLDDQVEYRNSKGEPWSKPRGRHTDARGFSLGVSSRADRFADARLRHGTRVHRFHPRRAPGICGIESKDGSRNDSACVAALGRRPAGSRRDISVRLRARTDRRARSVCCSA